jgi:hypothetical protein
VRTTLYCSTADLAAEDPRPVLERAVAAGIAGLTLAAAYHEASDYLPHNPRFRVHYTPAGVAFGADRARYPAELPPPPMLPACGGVDQLERLCEEAGAMGVPVDAWVVYLHRDGRPPGPGTVENAFGDPYPVALCPASPVARQYSIALTEDVCRYPVAAVSAESLHYHPLDHGAHHERRMAGPGERAAFLLSLCFCASCRRAAVDAGVDADRLARWVRAQVDGADSEPDPADLHRYLDLRVGHVTTLVQACAQAAGAAGVVFRFLDPSAAFAPAAKGGREYGRALGIDAAEVARAAHIGVPAYSPDPGRVAAECAAYRAVVPAERFGVILRPMPPDCSDADNLAEKVRAVVDGGASSLAYYHYGMMPLSMLDVVAEAHRRCLAG